MIYTLFFSRMRDLGVEGREAYSKHAGAIRSLALEGHPGFKDLKTYTAEDGERLTIVRFEDAPSQQAWKDDPVHREAQIKGRTTYYDWYHIVVCEPLREHEWTRPVPAG